MRGSLDDINVAAFAHCSFLYRVEGKGSCRPPKDLGRYRRLVSADLARPVQRLRNLVTMTSRFFSTQEMGRSAIDRSHVRRGQMASLKSLSFCCPVTKVASTRDSNLSSFAVSADLVSSWMLWTDTGAPKNLKVVLPMNGILSPQRESCGS